MVVNGLRDQDRLDVASNFVIWKTKILSVLDEHRIKDHVLHVVDVSVGAKQCLVGQKQSRGKQFLRRFLAKKSRSSVEQQHRKIKEEFFDIYWQKYFREQI